MDLASRYNFVQVDDDINVWKECDNNSASEKTPAVIFSIYKYFPLWDTHGNRSEISKKEKSASRT